MAIVDLLSQRIIVTPSSSCFISERILPSQIAWHAEETIAIYLASEEDKVVVAFFFKLHVMTPEPRLKVKLEVLFPSSIQPAQSLLVNPYNLKFVVLPYHIPKFIVPTTYHMILFATPRWCLVGLCINLDMTPIE